MSPKNTLKEALRTELKLFLVIEIVLKFVSFVNEYSVTYLAGWDGTLLRHLPCMLQAGGGETGSKYVQS